MSAPTQRCKDCRSLWPFVFALTLAALVSLPAWATFDLMALGAGAQTGGTALVFCVTATGMVLYVRWCMRRNCTLRRTLDQRRAGLAAAPR
ncbi:hypothetical protein [uncultured Thiohalocapsa sp.]|uniref:hypothetical protein n=1 Tax=uncultured Thiohalocapsa sp. TaxID=768990 RepID=UPI0025DAA2AA|nr:hypothetical protein [uncultured Thiohalocapsa sp.]